jgi:TolB-like protein
VKSFSGASNDDELRMRITDALITRLGNLDRVAVRPTSAVMPFTNSEEDGLSIGRKLKVDAIVDSRIQQEGDRLRVTIQLVRVADGEHLWAGQFDGRADRILDLQDTISAKVSQTFDAAATAGDVFVKRPTENSDAYEAYLKGRFFLDPPRRGIASQGHRILQPCRNARPRVFRGVLRPRGYAAPSVQLQHRRPARSR